MDNPDGLVKILVLLVNGDVKVILVVLMSLSMASLAIMVRHNIRATKNYHVEQIASLSQYIDTLKKEIENRNSEITKRETVIQDKNQKLEEIIKNYHAAVMTITESYNKIHNSMSKIEGILRR